MSPVVVYIDLLTSFCNKIVTMRELSLYHPDFQTSQLSLNQWVESSSLSGDTKS